MPLKIPHIRMVVNLPFFGGDRQAGTMKQYTLQLREKVERQLRGCRTSIRQSIRQKLQEILALADRPVRRRLLVPDGPPLRFYVFEGYRVSYEINARTRRVVVIELRTEPG
jgi:mRNA-degrading endonuclease RelE of RelBE toxin-antitoxin system